MPFCFLVQNIADIGQSVNEFIELWPKNDFQDGRHRHLELQNFNFWSRDSPGLISDVVYHIS